MKSNHNENHTSIELVKNYYRHLASGNIAALKDYFSPDVVLISPLAELSGQAAALDAAAKLAKQLDTITIRFCESNGKQVMLVYDFHFNNHIGRLRAAGLVTVNDHQIERIELFYDGRPFTGRESEIFSGQR